MGPATSGCDRRPIVQGLRDAQPAAFCVVFEGHVTCEAQTTAMSILQYPPPYKPGDDADAP